MYHAFTHHEYLSCQSPQTMSILITKNTPTPSEKKNHINIATPAFACFVFMANLFLPVYIQTIFISLFKMCILKIAYNFILLFYI